MTKLSKAVNLNSVSGKSFLKLWVTSIIFRAEVHKYNLWSLAICKVFYTGIAIGHLQILAVELTEI